MRKNLEVKELTIPKLKNGYLTDYRTVRFGVKNTDEYWEIECFLGGSDLNLSEDVEVFIEDMRECNPVSLRNDYPYGKYFLNYLCVGATEDNDGFVYYEFYRAPVLDENSTEVKPYSILYGRSRESFTVGNEYVFGYAKKN